MFKSIILVVTAAASSVAFASGGCPLKAEDVGPADQWQSQDKLKEKLTKDGYEVTRIKVDDKYCYEAYVKKDGKNAELYVNPKTLEPTMR